MANQELVEQLRDVNRWNQWRESEPGFPVDLRESDLREANLQGADLRGADLQGADLRGANLQGADLREANLRGADLSRTQVLGTSFERAELTGACLEDWNINSATKFDGAVCEYVYLKTGQQERRPYSGSFESGEFAVLFQQAADTVDLIFKDGINWLAFFRALQAVRYKYADQAIFIQAIEKKQGDAFVVRLGVFEAANKSAIKRNLEASKSIDKSAIKRDAQLLYDKRLKVLEAQYEKQLRLQGEQHLEEIQRLIEAERQEKLALMEVLTMMTSNQGSRYDLRGAQFAGGFAETVKGDQIGGTINNQSAETPSLAKAAAEIQKLLKQLEASNPSPTEAEQAAFLSAMIPPTRRERFISALQAAGGAALDEIPYGPVLKALVEGWQNPNG